MKDIIEIKYKVIKALGRPDENNYTIEQIDEWKKYADRLECLVYGLIIGTSVSSEAIAKAVENLSKKI